MEGRRAQIAGTCDPLFAGVEDALRENLAHRGELGAAVAVIVEGCAVVDLWCGWADEARSRPWREDTLVNAFSVGKAFAGLCVLMLASRGQLDLDERVCARWPEFAAAGKEAVTVRELMSHRAGLPGIDRQLPGGALYDWQLVTAVLAEQEPWWAPGKGHGYHVHTFGFLMGELVRRVTGEPIGSFLLGEVAQALGVELSFGLEPAKRTRRAEYVFELPSGARAWEAGGAGGDRSWRERAYLNPPGAMGLGTVNTAAWQDAEVPSANLHADARALARTYQALLDSTCPLVAGEVLREACTEASAGEDLVLGRPSRFGLAFQLTQPERPMGPNAGSYGHFGAGGSVGFADPQAEVAFAYVMNRGGPQWQDPRNRALIEAVYEALGCPSEPAPTG